MLNFRLAALAIAALVVTPSAGSPFAVIAQSPNFNPDGWRTSCSISRGVTVLTVWPTLTFS